jgi:hypothetical protein
LGSFRKKSPLALIASALAAFEVRGPGPATGLADELEPSVILTLSVLGILSPASQGDLDRFQG